VAYTSDRASTLAEPLGLLGRHVLRRSDHLARLGEQGALRAGDLGDPEVEHLDAQALFVPHQKDVRGLEVAMHDSPLVSRGDGVTHEPADPRDLSKREGRIARDAVRELFAVEELHHQEGGIAVLTQVDHIDDPGVPQ
jgi:hypothetical protein